jgi:hypothetical protein
MLLTMTHEQIAEKCEVTRHTVSNWVARASLKGPHGKHKASTGHEARVVAEFDPLGCAWLRKPMGKPFGGMGWHNFSGIERAREQV